MLFLLSRKARRFSLQNFYCFGPFFLFKENCPHSSISHLDSCTGNGRALRHVLIPKREIKQIRISIIIVWECLIKSEVSVGIYFLPYWTLLHFSDFLIQWCRPSIKYYLFCLLKIVTDWKNFVKEWAGLVWRVPTSSLFLDVFHMYIIMYCDAFWGFWREKHFFFSSTHNIKIPCVLVAFVVTKSCLCKASKVLGQFLPVPPQIKLFVYKLCCLHAV